MTAISLKADGAEGRAVRAARDAARERHAARPRDAAGQALRQRQAARSRARDGALDGAGARRPRRAAPHRGDPDADAAHDRQPGRRRPRPRRRHAAPRERRHRRRPARSSTRALRMSRTSSCARARPGAGGRRQRRPPVSVVQPNLSLGAHGASVRELERRLAELHYAIKRDGYFGSEDLEAVYAFQKVERLARTGSVDAALWSRIMAARTPRRPVRRRPRRGRQDAPGPVHRPRRQGDADGGHLDRRDGQHAARHLARLPQGRRLRLGPRTTRATSCAASPCTGTPTCRRIRRRTAARASRCGSRRRCTRRSATARRYTCTNEQRRRRSRAVPRADHRARPADPRRGQPAARARRRAEALQGRERDRVRRPRPRAHDDRRRASPRTTGRSATTACVRSTSSCSR